MNRLQYAAVMIIWFLIHNILFSIPEESTNVEKNAYEEFINMTKEERREYRRSRPLPKYSEGYEEIRDALSSYYWNKDTESLNILVEAMETPRHKYHRTIAKQLIPDEAILPHYLEFAEKQTDSIILSELSYAMGFAEPHPEIIDFLETLSENKDVSDSALIRVKNSLEKLRIKQAEKLKAAPESIDAKKYNGWLSVLIILGLLTTAFGGFYLFRRRS